MGQQGSNTIELDQLDVVEGGAKGTTQNEGIHNFPESQVEIRVLSDLLASSNTRFSVFQEMLGTLNFRVGSNTQDLMYLTKPIKTFLPKFCLPRVPNVLDDGLDLVDFVEIWGGHIHNEVCNDEEVLVGKFGEEGLFFLSLFNLLKHTNLHPFRLQTS